MVVAAYVEQLTAALSPASVKQHLAALRMLFDWLVVGQVPALQPREFGPGPQARRQDRQDPGPLHQGDEGCARRHRCLDAGGSSRPRLPRRPRLQLRARERRGLASRRRLLHPGAAFVLPAPREGRAVQRGSRPPHRPGLRRCLPRGGPHRRGPARAPLPELRARAARCTPGEGNVAVECVQDDQAPRPKGGATGRDLRPQLPRDSGSPSTCATAATSRSRPGSPGTSLPAPPSFTTDSERRSRSTRSSGSTSERLVATVLNRPRKRDNFTQRA